MKRVGIVGLDTSHSEAFASTLEADDDTDLTAVWDSGTVRNSEYTGEFCERYDATEFEAPGGMIDAVDAVMILTVDWDTHCELALPFLESDVPTLVDKPIAGRARDIDLIEAATNDTPFFGGSAVPYHPALDSFSEEPTSQSLYCAGYDDPFYYGCHLVDSVRRIADADWNVVRPASDPGLTFDVVFENNAFATIKLDGPEEDSNFAFLSISDEARAVVIESNDEERRAMYESYVDAYIDTIDGNLDESHRIFDGARLLLALHTALSERQAITPGSEKLDSVHVQGNSFVESYDPYY